MKGFDEYVALAEKAHGHICAGQILGLRMALFGLKLLNIDEPEGKDRKRLITFVEIDRCATDAIGVVTGCRLGKRALKFKDFGKMAATFCDLESGRAVRVMAKESSKDTARDLYPHLANKSEQQIRAYGELPEDQLFDTQWVRVDLPPEDLPGYKASPAVCSQCGEAVKFAREIRAERGILCRACAGESYYHPL
jgi:formylmethanofuran dehydrogenase subunit E